MSATASIYDSIPTATDYKGENPKYEPRKKRTGPNTGTLVDAAKQFVEELVELCRDAIEDKTLIISMNRENLLVRAQSVPRDVLLYGHRKRGKNNQVLRFWKHRSPLELPEMPFVTAQKQMLKKGWYLIEVSDYADTDNIVFHLYKSVPEDHPYFNMDKTLWHGNNMVPKLDH